MASSTAPQGQGIPRHEIQAAMAKAVELRALHSALLQGASGSPAVLRLPPGASPSISRGSNQFSAEDYPVFTPSYEEEPLPGYHYIRPENRSLSEIWRGIVLEEEGKDDEAISSDNKSVNRFSSSNSEQHICPANNHFSNRGSCINHLSLLQIAPGADILKSSSRRTSSGEFKTATTCNTCRPTTINRESKSDPKNHKNVTSTAPEPDTQPSTQLPTRPRGPILSWLFSKLKKKPNRRCLRTQCNLRTCRNF